MTSDPSTTFAIEDFMSILECNACNRLEGLMLLPCFHVLCGDCFESEEKIPCVLCCAGKGPRLPSADKSEPKGPGKSLPESTNESSPNSQGEVTGLSSAKAPVGQPWTKLNITHLGSALQRATALKRKAYPLCNACETVQGEVFCVQCRAFLCPECQQAHERLQWITHDHEVLSAQDSLKAFSSITLRRYEICSSHPSDVKKFSCKVTGEALCCMCLFEGDHVTHSGDSHSKIEDVCRNARKAVEEKSEKLDFMEKHLQDTNAELQTHLHLLGSEKKLAIEELKHMEKRLHELVQERFKRLTADVEAVAEPYEKLLAKNVSINSDLLELKTTLSPWVNMPVDYLPPADALQVLPKVNEKASAVLHCYHTEVVPIEYKSLSFVNEYLHQFRKDEDWPPLNTGKKVAKETSKVLTGALAQVFGKICLVTEDSNATPVVPDCPASPGITNPYDYEVDNAWLSTNSPSPSTDSALDCSTGESLESELRIMGKFDDRLKVPRKPKCKGKIRPFFRKTFHKLR